MTSYHFRCEKPLTSGQKRIVGSCNRKSRDLRWETADECEKRIVGSRGRKTAEKTRAQSPKSKLRKRGDRKTTPNKNDIFLLKFVLQERFL